MPEHKQCPPGSGCINLERALRIFDKTTTELVGDLELISSKVADLVEVVKGLPTGVTAAAKAERQELEKLLELTRGEVGERLKRGEGHFGTLFRRLDKLEKHILVLWILTVVIGLGELAKIALAVFPLVKGIIP